MEDRIRAYMIESARTMEASAEALSGALAEAARLIVAAFRAGGGVLLMGNGGSAADAQHIACELVARFRRERRALHAEALTTDASVLTAIGNDYDFERVFARQVEAKARAGDVVIALTTSGNSPNILAGLIEARARGCHTIVFSGEGGGKSADLADVLLAVPCGDTPHVQEVHAAMYHVLCELVEAAIAAE